MKKSIMGSVVGPHLLRFVEFVESDWEGGGGEGTGRRDGGGARQTVAEPGMCGRWHTAAGVLSPRRTAD
jgi:hypothetical protein